MHLFERFFSCANKIKSNEKKWRNDDANQLGIIQLVDLFHLLIGYK
jgi:hypothetical protein